MFNRMCRSIFTRRESNWNRDWLRAKVLVGGEGSAGLAGTRAERGEHPSGARGTSCAAARSLPRTLAAREREGGIPQRGGCGRQEGTEASHPAQEHGAALGAPGAQLVLPAKPLLSVLSCEHHGALGPAGTGEREARQGGRPQGASPVAEPGADPLTPLTPNLSLQEPGGQTAPKKAPGDCKGSPNPEQTRRLAQAMMAFTTDLFSLVAQSSTRPNLILSPLSVALALSHLALGAQNQTLQRLQQVLHVDSGPCLPHLLSRLCQDLGPGAFRLAARMYLQKGFPIKEDFVEQSEQLFGAKPMSLTGRKRDDLANINQWVKEATEGKIEDFLSDLPDDTVLLLLNAIHFQGFWRRKFDPDLTQRDTFHLDEQFTVPVDMMQAHTYPLRWFLLEQPEIQVAHFPFKNNMSFVVIMPTHFEWNVSQVLANLSWGILHQPLLRERPTKVQLPKLHLKYQMDLVAILSQLGRSMQRMGQKAALTNHLLAWAGLQELFQAPDLRGISDQSLVVSSVQHQSTLELREAGVEAAATTSTAMSRMSLSSFSVNRPFLFFILEDSTSLPLFVGSSFTISIFSIKCLLADPFSASPAVSLIGDDRKSFNRNPKRLFEAITRDRDSFGYDGTGEESFPPTKLATESLHYYQDSSVLAFTSQYVQTVSVSRRLNGGRTTNPRLMFERWLAAKPTANKKAPEKESHKTLLPPGKKQDVDLCTEFTFMGISYQPGRLTLEPQDRASEELYTHPNSHIIVSYGEEIWDPGFSMEADTPTHTVLDGPTIPGIVLGTQLLLPKIMLFIEAITYFSIMQFGADSSKTRQSPSANDTGEITGRSRSRLKQQQQENNNDTQQHNGISAPQGPGEGEWTLEPNCRVFMAAGLGGTVRKLRSESRLSHLLERIMNINEAQTLAVVPKETAMIWMGNSHSKVFINMSLDIHGQNVDAVLELRFSTYDPREGFIRRFPSGDWAQLIQPPMTGYDKATFASNPLGISALVPEAFGLCLASRQFTKGLSYWLDPALMTYFHLEDKIAKRFDILKRVKSINSAIKILFMNSESKPKSEQ
ncbi:hypothetical protein E2I00_019374 [Balaenoptera physalus]|uniref:Serpin domain-containing protein n=1 Tax=Balaenoptera physalus TaxID=9770 RepID=A0A6A1Q2V9_BALPH|nr:hypothetical protein E2I00_019374 [Balaenoptera physalus]